MSTYSVKVHRSINTFNYPRRNHGDAVAAFWVVEQENEFISPKTGNRRSPCLRMAAICR
jgi:hypothetical protein